MKARTAARFGLAVLAAAMVVALATSTRVLRAPAHRAGYVHTGPLALRYVRSGSGPTVVLVHGFGESLLSWRAVFDQLARHADVLALDLPGFGLSSKPPSGYATDSLAADVLGALTALGVRRAVLVGHSMGGAVVFAAALQDPARVRALVLVDPALVGTPAPVSEARRSDSARGGATPFIAEYEVLRTRFTAPHDPDWLAETDSARAYAPADDPAYRGAVAAVLREFDFAYLTDARANAWRLPALVLWGEFDEIFPLEEGRRLAGRLQGARFEMIPRSWHRPQVERPVQTATAIDQFVTGLDRPSGQGTP
ncbi:MAG: alpha/beta fold hydrolase [Gemmatimonadales bacterium]